MAEYRTTDDIAALLDVTPETIRSYRALSKPGKRYAGHPFPAPDRLIGRTPVWSEGRDAELRDWATARVGQGKGGGRPAHRDTED